MLKTQLIRVIKPRILYSVAFPFSQKEVYDLRKPDNKSNKKYLMTSSPTRTMIIHPIFFPNNGPVKELYLAEEAIGLAKSLNWTVIEGPFWKEKDWEKTPETTIVNPDDSNEKEYKSRSLRRNPNLKDQKKIINEDEGWTTVGETKLRNGDYVVTPAFKGVYHRGAIAVDLDSDSDDGDMYNEWKNKLLRASLAKTSLMKVRKTRASTFFTKGKLYEIGEYLAKNKIDAVFVNTELTSRQTKNLEVYWTNVYNEKPFDKNKNPMNDSDFESDVSDTENNQTSTNQKTIRVFDRFTMILQIFAKRAKTKMARLQIELCFLQFLKTKLVRDGGSTFSSYFNIFEGDLMNAKEMKLEVVSAKQRRATGVMSGSGETQLEAERRLINDKESKIKKELAAEANNQKFLRQKRKTHSDQIPKIALIGYTNAGKSALMNQLTNEEMVESNDVLFQTLNTTARKIILPSGQRAILLDTIGFITNLPHELVDSFKSTLEEVLMADLVLHIRDISHPHSDDQKKVVLQVLKDIEFDESFYTKKMVEVWNKIDLIERPLDLDSIKNSDYPIIPISALLGTNCKKLLETVEEKTNVLMNKKLTKLIHSLDHHGQRLKWLAANANLTNFEKIDYHYDGNKEFPEGWVEMEVYLDEATHRRYLASFGAYEKNKSLKGMPPKDWMQGSRSYFDRKKQ